MLDRTEVEADLSRFAHDYGLYLKERSDSFELEPDVPCKFVVVSRAMFADRFYMTGVGNVNVLALGYWERLMAPPSLVEFILSLILHASSNELPSVSFASHFGTKGCLYDFNADLSNARFVALHGHVCSYCRQKLHDAGHEKLADEMDSILSKKWLGRVSDPNSPAGIAAKLGYDLFATKGLTPRWSEKLFAGLKEDGVKELIRIAGEILIVALLIMLGLKHTEQEPKRPSQVIVIPQIPPPPSVGPIFWAPLVPSATPNAQTANP